MCNKGKPCFTLFSKEHYQDVQDQCATLSREELDLVILGQIATMRIRLRRGRTMPFGKGPGCVFPHGVRICRATFLKLHGVGKYNVIVMCNRGIAMYCTFLGKGRFIVLKTLWG